MIPKPLTVRSTLEKRDNPPPPLVYKPYQIPTPQVQEGYRAYKPPALPVRSGQYEVYKRDT
jgi:hypothetical protein